MDKSAKEVPTTIFGFTLFCLKELVEQRRWILFPVWVILGVIALFLLLGGGSMILPAIYIAF